MHSYDIIAYCGEGEILCDGCGEELYDESDENCEVSPIFADNESDAFGATCGSCGKCYVINDGWTLHEDAVNPEFTRWASCRECGSQYPFSTGYGFRDARQDALLGKLVCNNCLKPAVHF